MDLDLELDVVEHEPTVLEFARFHNLCSDFTYELPQCYNSVSISNETFDLDLCDPKDAPPLTDPADELTKERLAVSKEAAMLLKSVHSQAEAPHALLLISNGKKRIINLKQEVPILRTDNEYDLLGFGSVVEPKFTDLNIPLEPIDEDNDEGLGWPSGWVDFPKQCNEQVKSEKLGVSRETLLYLQDAIRNACSPEDSDPIKQETLFYRKNIAIQPVTPPLLPLTRLLTPYIPSSPGNHLELISDDSNSTAVEAKALQDQLMASDVLVRHDSNGSDTMLLDMLDPGVYEPSLDVINSTPMKRKASDLKIEGPLTPLMFSESPAKKLKTVAFAEILVEYIPNLPSKYGDGHVNGLEVPFAYGHDPDLPSNHENGNDILSREDDYAFFRNFIEPTAKSANWRVENEKLSEADTTRRMPVPHVDFRLATTPWDEFTRRDTLDPSETEINAQSRFILWVKRNHMKSATSWHGISMLERILPLGPFSYESAKVSAEEQLHGEDVLTQILCDLAVGDIATSSTDMWKREGLRIFENEEQDEETLQTADLGERKGMSSLIRKRQLEMQEAARDYSQMKSSTLTTVDDGVKPRHEVIGSHHWRNGTSIPVANATLRKVETRKRSIQLDSAHSKPIQKGEKDMSLMFGGRFSASSALDTFMALHGMAAKPNARETDEPFSKRSREPPLPSPVHLAKQTRVDTDELSRVGMQLAPELLSRPPNLPPLPKSMPPCSFVISSTLLQRRSLSKQIECLYPDAEFVSRDFDYQFAVSKEADLILSPSTGLILTTLQQLRQRALPGQPERSLVKDRLLALQDVYERLVILISEGLNQEMEEQGSGSDPRDQDIIADYERIAVQMDSEVIVRYIPGGEKALARTTVGEMAQFGLPHGSKDIGDIKLLPDQTTWELFLRRAGLNAFAAQVILALLKDPVDWPQLLYGNSDPAPDLMQTCGLQTFLFMSAEARVRSFQAILGGSRILIKVSALLDELWLSAAHGFRL